MSNRATREALRGEEARIFDIVSEAFSAEKWAELLECALERAAAAGDRRLARKLMVGAGAQAGNSLNVAIEGGHGELVNDLLENGADVDFQDPRGNSPLHAAAKVGDAQSTRSLLLKGADFTAVNEKERIPLYRAARHGSLAVAQELLAADVDAVSRPCARR